MEIFKLDDRQSKELAKKMIIPYFFTDRNLKLELKINLDSHHIDHAKLIIKPTYSEFGIEVPYINKIIKEISFLYAGILNQNKFRYQTVFSAGFDKEDEDNQVLDETDLFNNLNINHILTKSDLDKIAIKFPLEHQIQQKEIKDSGRRFDKLEPMTIYFYRTGGMDGSNYVKIPLRANALLNIENNDKYCFLWSILASLHPCIDNHPKRVSNFKQYFNELNFESFNFTGAFKCSDVHKFEKINNLSMNIFQLNFYQDQNKWRHKVIPIENCENDFCRVIDF